MTTAAAGCITKAEERIRDMLANCTQFQTWTGAADATAAKDYIHYTGVPLPNANEDTTELAYWVSIRPFAIVSTESFRISNLQGPSGIIWVRFEDNISTVDGYSFDEGERLFLNNVGQVMQSGDTSNPGLEELSITQQYAEIREQQVQHILRTSDNESDTQGDAIAAEVRVSWGVIR